MTRNLGNLRVGFGRFSIRTRFFHMRLVAYTQDPASSTDVSALVIGVEAVEAVEAEHMNR